MGLIRFLMFTFLTVDVAVSKRMSRDKLVDLSYTFDESSIGWVTATPFEMRSTQKGPTADNDWLQEEEYSSGTHVGTHVDAPCHMVQGRWTIDEIPLDHLVARAAVIDITSRVDVNRDAFVLAQDFLEWEMKTGHTLDDTIVLVRTGLGKWWPDREAYMGTAYDINNLHFPGISPEAADWLVKNRRVYGVGIEALSLDNGPNFGRGAPAHKILLGANIHGIENLANMHKLPISGAVVHVFPIKLKGACAAPARVVAYLP